jgi:hypothetical protein
VELARELLDESPDDERLRDLLIDAYIRWVNSGKDMPDASRITEDLARWTDDDTLKIRRTLVLNATVAKDRSDLTALEAASALSDELRTLWTQAPEDLDIRYHLVHALLQQARAVRDAMTSLPAKRRAPLRDRIKDLRTECARHATALMASEGFTDGKRREQIGQILQNVRSEENPPQTTG